MDSTSKQTASADAEGQGSIKTSTGGQISIDVAAASFLDVAVLRALFIMDWQEEGVYWGLLFVYNR